MGNLIKGIIRKITLVDMMATLKGVEESCKEISDNIAERLKQMPRASTCVHSEVPNGRTFCSHYGKCCISYCNSCENFENRYLQEAA